MPVSVRVAIEAPGHSPQGDHDITAPVSNLAKKIVYTDSFTLDEATQGSLQVVVKLGHPEWPASQNQNQDERFNMFLVSPGGTKIELAKFLDDVSSGSGLEDDAYYRYVYAPGLLPAGTWSPVFETVAGSIEFRTLLSIPSPPNEIPEPGTVALLAAGLAALGWTARRRRT